MQSIRIIVKSASLPIALLLIACFVVACAVATPPMREVSRDAAADVAVTIDATTRYQTMDGFGSSERVLDDPHVTDTFSPTTKRAAAVIPPSDQDQIYDALYTELGLTRVRPVLEGDIEPTNDNDDPFDTDLSKFNFAWKRNDAHIEYVQEARKRGATVYFPAPIKLEHWMREDEPDEYAEWVYAVIRRWQEKGVELPYFSLINEPGYERSGYWSGRFMRDVLKTVGPRLRAEGIGTMFVVPDDLNASQAARRAQTILANPEARKYVGALGFHLYNEPLSTVSKMVQLGQHYNLPLWMTEYSVKNGLSWAELVHDLIVNYDITAVDHMWGVFGQWEPGHAAYVTIETAGSVYTGSKRTKKYYYTGQFSRFVLPGAVRIGARTNNDHIKVSAYIHHKDCTITIVAINTGASTVATSFALQGVAISRLDRVVLTSKSQNWMELPVPTVSADTFTYRLPPRSVTTFQASEGSPNSAPNGPPNLSRTFP